MQFIIFSIHYIQIFDFYRYIVAQGAMHEPGKTKQKYKLAENRNSNK